MSEETPKRRRGRPPEGDRAMTAAERQRRARLRKTRSPKWGQVDVAKAEIQAVNWPLHRIEEAITAMDDSGERERLLRYCQAIWTFRERALEALKKAGIDS